MPIKTIPVFCYSHFPLSTESSLPLMFCSANGSLSNCRFATEKSPKIDFGCFRSLLWGIISMHMGIVFLYERD